MKNILIALVLLLVVTSCLPDKIGKKDPEPELAGTYQVSQISSGGVTENYPQNGISASLPVTRPSDTQITFRLVTNDNGQVQNSQTITATLSKSSGNDYDVLIQGTRRGSINGTDFKLDLVNGSTTVSIVARK